MGDSLAIFYAEIFSKLITAPKIVLYQWVTRHRFCKIPRLLFVKAVFRL
jgi:hypothetical protein